MGEYGKQMYKQMIKVYVRVFMYCVFFYFISETITTMNRMPFKCVNKCK